jgi:hypothetical protein
MKHANPCYVIFVCYPADVITEQSVLSKPVTNSSETRVMIPKSTLRFDISVKEVITSMLTVLFKSFYFYNIQILEHVVFYFVLFFFFPLTNIMYIHLLNSILNNVLFYNEIFHVLKHFMLGYYPKLY